MNASIEDMQKILEILLEFHRIDVVEKEDSRSLHKRFSRPVLNDVSA